jgi:hypothetical protein
MAVDDARGEHKKVVGEFNVEDRMVILKMSNSGDS